MPNQRKYGYPSGLCGIYKITNKFTDECYIGQSLNITSRFSTHFGRDAKNTNYQKWHKFYRDINELGINGFNLEILELCDKERLLEREQFWFDYYKPTYNVIRPTKFHSKDPISKKHLSESMNSKLHKVKMKNIWNSKEFKLKCRLIHTKGKNKMKPCLMINVNDEIIKEFGCLIEQLDISQITLILKEKTKFQKLKVYAMVKEKLHMDINGNIKKCRDYPEREYNYY